MIKLTRREYKELISDANRVDIARDYLERENSSYVDAEPLLAILGSEKVFKDDVEDDTENVG